MIRLCVRAKQPGTLKAILAAIPQPLHARIDEVVCIRGRDVPAKADFVVHCTQAKPSQPAEWFAASRGTYITCLPEAMDWFQQKLQKLVDSNADVVILDAGLHKILRLV